MPVVCLRVTFTFRCQTEVCYDCSSLWHPGKKCSEVRLSDEDTIDGRGRQGARVGDGDDDG
eukprot:748238-Hanusia_phi.AAC.1